MQAVNGLSHPGQKGPRPKAKEPMPPAMLPEWKKEKLTGWRDVLLQEGPEGLAKKVRDRLGAGRCPLVVSQGTGAHHVGSFCSMMLLTSCSNGNQLNVTALSRMGMRTLHCGDRYSHLTAAGVAHPGPWSHPLADPRAQGRPADGHHMA